MMDVTYIVLEPTGTWFLADPRKHTGDDEHWYCVHNGTVSQQNLQRSIQYQERSVVRGDNPVFVFEARNKTQVNDWLYNNGYVIKTYNTKKRHPDMNERERKIKAAEGMIRRAMDQIEFLTSLPEEPTAKDDQPLVIFFQKKFNRGGRIYDYSAIKAGDGLWYTTGPASPKGYTWDALVEWMFADPDFTPTIWQAKKFRALS